MRQMLRLKPIRNGLVILNANWPKWTSQSYKCKVQALLVSCLTISWLRSIKLREMPD